MKLVYKIVFAVLIMFGIVLPLAINAQDNLKDYHEYDKLYLKGGTVFYGKILDYNDKFVKFELLHGKVIQFNKRSVKKVVQQLNEEAEERFQFKSRSPYHFKETGWYNSTYFNLPQGFNSQSWWQVGLGLHHVAGYQHQRLLGTGFGLGLDGYDMGNARNVLAAYGEIRGYLLAENFSPFYTVALGYGFALKNRDLNVINSKGGLFFNPSIGYRFGGSANANFMMGLGYKLQQATFSDQGWGGSVSKQKYNFNRVNLKVGLIF